MCIPLHNFKHVAKITILYCSIFYRQMIKVVLYVSFPSSAAQQQCASPATVSRHSSSSCFSSLLSCHLPTVRSRTCQRHPSLDTKNKDVLDLTRSWTPTNSRFRPNDREESCLVQITYYLNYLLLNFSSGLNKVHVSSLHLRKPRPFQTQNAVHSKHLRPTSQKYTSQKFSEYKNTLKNSKT